MEEKTKTLIGIIEINKAKRLRDTLLEKDIEIQIVRNDATCVKGCAVSVEVWANNNDLHEIGKTLREEELKILHGEGLDIDPELENKVFNPDEEMATCPACGTSFKTTLKECPECGLVFIPHK